MDGVGHCPPANTFCALLTLIDISRWMTEATCSMKLGTARQYITNCELTLRTDFDRDYLPDGLVRMIGVNR